MSALSIFADLTVILNPALFSLKEDNNNKEYFSNRVNKTEDIVGCTSGVLGP